MKKGSIRYKIKHELRPFVHDGVARLDALEVLSDAIPLSVQETYDQIKNKRRYFFLCRRYKKIVNSVEIHNAKVKSIFERLDAISIDSLYADPNAISKTYLAVTDEARKYVIAEKNPYRKTIDEIRCFFANIDKIRDQWPVWKELDSLRKEVASSPDFLSAETRHLYEKRDAKVREKVLAFKHQYYPFDSYEPISFYIEAHNDAILERLAKDPIFDDVNGLSLDAQQRKAASTPERSALVIAGAGSGKTLTICGRVRYLLERKSVRPEEILLLSYSKKSADDLAAKAALIDSRLRVGTFHKIGLDILKEESGGKFVIEEQWDAIIEEYFRTVVYQRPKALRDVLTYYGMYLSSDDDEKKYADQGELYADLKQADFVTFKESLLSMSRDRNGKETIKRERVKSFEELALANFYFINGIEYEYERPYEVDVSSPDRRQYTPDFYLKDYNIYHEHFGINAQGRARQFDGPTERDYLRGVAWKRMCHEKHGTTLIETTSADFSSGVVFDRLTEELKMHGVEFKPIDIDVIREALQSVYNGQSYRSFINLVKSFLSLYKARHVDASWFDRLCETPERFPFLQKRKELFLAICKDVYGYYMDRIRGEGKIDFDDMILRSAKLLPNIEGFRFKHVIVDEFQDISFSRAMLLTALIDHGKANLFAVGDDWQSIYRFSGSDLNILLDFDDYFGDSKRYFIERVHRNSQQLQDAMKRFVERNPEQIKKNIVASKSLVSPIRVIYYGADEEYQALQEAFSMIRIFQKDAKVLLLGRNNRDIDKFLSHNFYLDKKKETFVSKDFPEFTIRYSTVHGSKGLEEDYVVLLSAENARNGFPNKTEDDPLLNLVMSAPSEYPYAEERRLWYVAMTRTKNYAFVLSPIAAPSEFLLEMEGDIFVTNPALQSKQSDLIACPDCKSGHLVMREKDGKPFYGCSNFPYCRYSISDLKAVDQGVICPDCGDFMVLRQSKGHYFYGCHRYPICRATLNFASKK